MYEYRDCEQTPQDWAEMMKLEIGYYLFEMFNSALYILFLQCPAKKTSTPTRAHWE